jgi:hypothetical protein
MSVDDLGETLRSIAIKLCLVQLTSDDERRVREVVKELQSILDAGRALDKNQARLV